MVLNQSKRNLLHLSQKGIPPAIHQVRKKVLAFPNNQIQAGKTKLHALTPIKSLKVKI